MATKKEIICSLNKVTEIVFTSKVIKVFWVWYTVSLISVFLTSVLAGSAFVYGDLPIVDRGPYWGVFAKIAIFTIIGMIYFSSCSILNYLNHSRSQSSEQISFDQYAMALRQESNFPVRFIPIKNFQIYRFLAIFLIAVIFTSLV